MFALLVVLCGGVLIGVRVWRLCGVLMVLCGLGFNGVFICRLLLFVVVVA